MTKTEFATFLMRLLEQIENSEEEHEVEGDTVILDAAVVIAFEQPISDETVRRGVMLRSTSRNKYRVCGLLQEGIEVERSG